MANKSARRVLILDGNLGRAYLLCLVLSAEGFSVVIFTSSHEALKAIHEADILLTEYHLPEMTGLEVARRAYAHGWRGSLFIMSGQGVAIEEPVEHPLLHSILEKPFSTHDLVQKLHFCEEL